MTKTSGKAGDALCLKTLLPAVALVLSLLVSGCEEERSGTAAVPSRTGPDNVRLGGEVVYAASKLDLDDRYRRVIEFKEIGVKIPIERSDVYVRIDEPCEDLDGHLHELLEELGVRNAKIHNQDPTSSGRTMHLSFGDGKECSFVFIRHHEEEGYDRMVYEHEKYHALCRTVAEKLTLLEDAILQKGFNLELSAYDEELGATIVQILALHLTGVALEDISGSEYPVRARDILLAARIKDPGRRGDEP